MLIRCSDQAGCISCFSLSGFVCVSCSAANLYLTLKPILSLLATVMADGKGGFNELLFLLEIKLSL